MDNLQYIDEYFKGSNTDAEKQAFQQRITGDAAFAEEVAFYISANQVAKEKAEQQKKHRFREIYESQQLKTIAPAPVRNFTRYMAAASVAATLLIISSVFFFNTTSPDQLVDKYVLQNWNELSVTMGNDNNAIQKGLELYNAGNFKGAVIAFKNMLTADSTNAYARKYLGIAFYQLVQPDSAIVYFDALGNDATLHSNPGKFYKAIALMKRGKPGDKEAAKDLLQEVVAKDLEGKQEAAGWLEKLK